LCACACPGGRHYSCGLASGLSRASFRLLGTVALQSLYHIGNVAFAVWIGVCISWTRSQWLQWCQGLSRVVVLLPCEPTLNVLVRASPSRFLHFPTKPMLAHSTGRRSILRDAENGSARVSVSTPYASAREFPVVLSATVVAGLALCALHAYIRTSQVPTDGLWSWFTFADPPSPPAVAASQDVVDALAQGIGAQNLTQELLELVEVVSTAAAQPMAGAQSLVGEVVQ
jgi:hypothetical protein